MDEVFTRRILEGLGLVPLPSWEVELPAAIHQVCKQRGLSPEELGTRLDSEPAALRELAGLLTVGETYFLREPRQFEEVVRHVAGRHEAGRQAVVWSAGCASGEEPYSIAISIARAAPHLAPFVRILGSDISRESLEKARRGVYRSWSFRSTPEWVTREYFGSSEDREERGALVLAASIRARVELVEESIQARISSSAPASVDVIMFRNVSIYLDAAALREIYAGFRRVLQSGGLLVVGAGDVRPAPELFRSIPGDVSGLYAPLSPAERAPDAYLPPIFAATPQPPAAVARRRSCSALPVVAAAPRVDRGPSVNLAPPPAPQPLRLPELARDLGDKGNLQGALEAISRQIAGSPEAPAGYLVRGQIRLAADAIDTALADLRRAVFLQPDDRIARYWLSVALRAAGLAGQAMTQLSELKRALGAVAEQQLLEDGATSAGELLRAVENDLGALQ